MTPNINLQVPRSWLIYMSKKELAFLEGRLLSSQSEQFKIFQKALIGLKKPALQKKHFFGHANRLNFNCTKSESVLKLSQI